MKIIFSLERYLCAFLWISIIFLLSCQEEEKLSPSNQHWYPSYNDVNIKLLGLDTLDPVAIQDHISSLIVLRAYQKAYDLLLPFDSLESSYMTDSTLFAQYCMNKGRVLLKLVSENTSLADTAKSYLHKAVSLKSYIQDHDLIWLYNDLSTGSNYYWKDGQINTYLNQQDSLLKQLDYHHPSVPMFLNSHYNSIREDYNVSNLLLHKALSYIPDKDSSQLAFFHYQIANNEYSAYEYKEAALNYRKAIIFSRTDQYKDELADCYIRMKDYPRADSILVKLEETDQVIYKKGLNAYYQDKLSNSIDHLEKLSDTSNIGMFEYIQSQSTLAKIYLSQKDLTNSLRSIRQGISSYKKQRIGDQINLKIPYLQLMSDLISYYSTLATIEREKISYLDSCYNAVENVLQEVKLIFDQSNDEELISQMKNIKRVLISIIRSLTQIKHESLSAKSLTQIQNYIIRCMDENKANLLYQYQILQQDSSTFPIYEKKINVRSTELDQIVNSYSIEEILHLIENKRKVNQEKKDSEKYSSKTNFSYAIEDIQASLDTQTCVLGYILGNNEFMRYIITKDRLRTDILPLDSIKIQSIKNFITHFDVPPNRVENTNMWKYGKEVKELLLKDVFTVLETKKNWIVIPDGILIDLPFELLPRVDTAISSQLRDFPYLEKSFNIQYDLSLKLLSHHGPNKLKNPKSSILGLSKIPGLPLSGTQKEVHLITDLMENSLAYQSLLEADANRVNYRLAIQNSSILHIASHGYSDLYHIGGSYLLLAAQNGIDTFFTYDILKYPMTCDLVVLSACETNRGPYIQGEENYNLGTTFIMAGAKTVMSTRWKIPDQAAPKIIESFYKHFLNGKDAHQSLKLAKLEYLDSVPDQRTHPYYWAGYKLLGSQVSLLPIEKKI